MEIIRHDIADDLVIWQGDVREALKYLPDESVQCVVTSPPYFGLRDYGTAKWEGGDPNCRHEMPKWTEDPGDAGLAEENVVNANVAKWIKRTGGRCPKCGARRIDSQIGLEPTPEAYVETMVQVFREVRRVLRKDGTLWLNLGDSYNGSGGAGGDYNEGGLKEGQPRYPGRRIEGLKPKDLLMIPERVALALQADGWYLRAKPPWVKGNCMPESVTDRPTTAHESIFLFSKSEQYFYDLDAVRVPQATTDPRKTTFKRESGKRVEGAYGLTKSHRPDREDTEPHPLGRNRRTSDWWHDSLDALIEHYTAYLAHLQHIRDHGGMLLDEAGMPAGFMVNTQPFKEAHFAVWPPRLVEPMVLASTSPKGCPKCGAPWERVVERIQLEERDDTGRTKSLREHRMGKAAPPEKGWQAERRTVDWQPTCSCAENDGSGKCIVLDPFHGSGTTGQVALQYGRAYWGIELNPDYIRMSLRARLRGTQTSLLGLL